MATCRLCMPFSSQGCHDLRAHTSSWQFSESGQLQSTSCENFHSIVGCPKHVQLELEVQRDFNLLAKRTLVLLSFGCLAIAPWFCFLSSGFALLDQPDCLNL